jgi:hypothetical protein
LKSNCDLPFKHPKLLDGNSTPIYRIISNWR